VPENRDEGELHRFSPLIAVLRCELVIEVGLGPGVVGQGNLGDASGRIAGRLRLERGRAPSAARDQVE
jgi:hypothetical protein